MAVTKSRRFFKIGIDDNEPQYRFRYAIQDVGNGLVELTPEVGNIGNQEAQPMSGENMVNIDQSLDYIDENLLHVQINYQEHKVSGDTGDGKPRVDMHDVTKKTGFYSSTNTATHMPDGMVSNAGYHTYSGNGRGAGIHSNINDCRTWVKAQYNGVWNTKELALKEFVEDEFVKNRGITNSVLLWEGASFMHDGSQPLTLNLNAFENQAMKDVFVLNLQFCRYDDVNNEVVEYAFQEFQLWNSAGDADGFYGTHFCNVSDGTTSTQSVKRIVVSDGTLTGTSIDNNNSRKIVLHRVFGKAR